MNERDPRSAAEWTTLAVSCFVLGVLVALIALQLGTTRDPAAPVAVVESDVRTAEGLHHIDVTVTNQGDETAANVQISAELVVDGSTSTADQVIDFLAGGEAEALVFVFDEDPADGELTVDVSVAVP